MIPVQISILLISPILYQFPYWFLIYDGWVEPAVAWEIAIATVLSVINKLINYMKWKIICTPIISFRYSQSKKLRRVAWLGSSGPRVSNTWHSWSLNPWLLSSFFVKTFLPLCYDSSFFQVSISKRFDIIVLQYATFIKTCSEAYDYDASDNLEPVLKLNWMESRLSNLAADYRHINSVW